MKIPFERKFAACFVGTFTVLAACGCDADEESNKDSTSSVGSGGSDSGEASTGGQGGAAPSTDPEKASGSDLFIPRKSTLELEAIPDPATSNLEFLGARARRMKIDGVWSGLVSRFALIDLDPPEPICENNSLGLSECTWLMELPGTTYTFVGAELAERTFEWKVFIEGGTPRVERFMQIEGTMTDEIGAFRNLLARP